MTKDKEKRIKARSDMIKHLQEKKPLQRVDGDIIGVFDKESIYNDIQGLINQFMTIHNIDDMTKAPQRVFMALSSYIGSKLFENSDILKDKTNIVNGSAFPSTCNRYNIESLAYCINLYADLCNLYNKAFLFDGVASFLSCSENTLKENNDKLSALGCDIYKKREGSLASSAVDSKTQNITGILASLNHWHGWTKESTQKTTNNTVIIYPSLSDFQKQASIPGNNQTL